MIKHLGIILGLKLKLKIVFSTRILYFIAPSACFNFIDGEEYIYIYTHVSTIIHNIYFTNYV